MDVPEAVCLPKQYDAVVIFDADNLVHLDFLMEINNRYCKGERLIQGYLDSKNPNDTWVSGVFAISFWIINHVWHLAKYNIGLSSVFGGTGMCISTDILKKYGWQATCLTEDMEFTMKSLLEGIPTTWCHDAIVYDEKVVTFKQSWNQRKRWAQGHFDVAERYIPKLLKEGIKRRDIVILDGIIDLIQPYFLLISAFFVICSTIYSFVPFYTNVLYALLPYEIWQVIGIGQYVIPAIILFKIHAAPKSWFYTLFYTAGFPLPWPALSIAMNTPGATPCIPGTSALTMCWCRKAQKWDPSRLSTPKRETKTKPEAVQRCTASSFWARGALQWYLCSLYLANMVK